MIRLTRINQKPLVLNSDLIEHIEVTPDTVISMVTGQKFMVQESADEIIRRILEFRQELAGQQKFGPPVHLTGVGLRPPAMASGDEEDE